MWRKINFCTLARAKTTESLVRGKVDEGLDSGDIAPVALKRCVLVHTWHLLL